MKQPLRVLITGSRDCTEQQAESIHGSLDAMVASFGPLVAEHGIVIVHGQCPRGGVDLIAHLWALDHPNAVPEAHPADWKRHGRAAGNIRNTEMVDAGAFICLAFPGPKSVGTWDCIRKAAGAGIPTHIYPLKALK